MKPDLGSETQALMRDEIIHVCRTGKFRHASLGWQCMLLRAYGQCRCTR